MDAKKQALLELIKQMNKLIVEDSGDEPVSLSDTMKGVEDEVVEPPTEESEEEGEMSEEPMMDERKSFMKGLRPKPKGKSLSVVAIDIMKKPKAKKYG